MSLRDRRVLQHTVRKPPTTTRRRRTRRPKNTADPTRNSTNPKSHNQHDVSFSCVHGFPWDPCVDESMKFGLVACRCRSSLRTVPQTLHVTLMKRAFELLCVTSLHPPGHGPTAVGSPVLRCTVEVVTSNAAVSLCPREKFTHVRRHNLCLDQRYNLFRMISQNNSIQHTTVPSSLELFVPACRVISLTQSWFSFVIHGVYVENTALLSVNSGGSVRSQRCLPG